MHHDHGQCTPADFFSQLGIDVVLCNGIGAGAIARLQMMGIDVYMAELSQTLEEALTRFSSGLLAKVTSQQACQGHSCH
jgi:predicted Fe-Mo cluster-binding NifX family protein